MAIGYTSGRTAALVRVYASRCGSGPHGKTQGALPPRGAGPSIGDPSGAAGPASLAMQSLAARNLLSQFLVTGRILLVARLFESTDSNFVIRRSPSPK
jgi:hypothetical protein